MEFSNEVFALNLLQAKFSDELKVFEVDFEGFSWNEFRSFFLEFIGLCCDLLLT